jgi:argininosuccinate synthase
VGYNNNKLSLVTLLEQLNEIGGKHGVGRIDMVENRLVGMNAWRHNIGSCLP